MKNQPVNKSLLGFIFLLGMSVSLITFSADIANHSATVLVDANSKVTPSTEESIIDAFSREVVQSGAFTQERWLKILKEPLVSHGTFEIEKNAFIRWHLTSPFELLYEYDGKVLLLTEDGKTKAVDRKSDPLLYGFFAFFFKVFHLSYQELGEWFEIEFSPASENNKRIGLKPKKDFMKKAFTEARIVEVSGRIESISILESKGDTLQLHFNYGQTCKDCQK